MPLLLLSLIACDEGTQTPPATEESVDTDWHVPVDGDGDGWAANPTDGPADCDDSDPLVHPLQTEVCDGIDNNCSGTADEGFPDTDADGTADCQDVETCDGLDNNGDGTVDEGLPDTDGDGLCDALDVEECDGLDNNGDGIVDEGFDADGDGVAACMDCDDGSTDVFPGGQELIDGLDNDCDALIDEGLWAEGDLIITELMVNPAAVADPVGEWVEVFNGSERTVYLNGLLLNEVVLTPDAPLAVEPGAYAVLVSDERGPTPGDVAYTGLSLSNEGGELSLTADGVLLDAVSWDAVEGGASWSLEPMQRDAGLNDLADAWCVATSGEGDLGTPGADNDGCPAFDHDGDGISELEGDCDDDDASVHPGAGEVYYDGIDADCAGDDDFDADGDGAQGGDENAADCDDTDPEVHPDAVEVCDGIDNDCDGSADDGAVDALAWFADSDGDGYGDDGSTRWACEAPSGHTGIDGDCDDSDSDSHPDAEEVCDDGIDNDCDGAAQFCDEVDYPVGGDASSWTTSGYYRGNLFEAEDDGELLRFEVRLDIASSCALDFRVYEAEDIDGEWTLLWSDTVTRSGEGYHSSGGIEQAVEAGLYYSLGVGWSCEVTYYGEYGDFLDDDGGVGLFAGTHYDNSYSGVSDDYVPASTGSGTVSYDQVVYIGE